ncbi:hypothetical protein EVAR_93240_1 [Eumeta japonica]|uniref:Uncharacterized protein n=1 Tax=Eumeta variegata TaxID=151549 RepID=A0A4C1TXN9_EUMVA|nr:hypothetical protein EVAR_93240_1 [Eumeta japonica]
MTKPGPRDIGHKWRHYSTTTNRRGDLAEGRKYYTCMRPRIAPIPLTVTACRQTGRDIPCHMVMLSLLRLSEDRQLPYMGGVAGIELNASSSPSPFPPTSFPPLRAIAMQMFLSPLFILLSRLGSFVSLEISAPRANPPP